MPKVFHLLPESEMFSEFHGGAISRWVANVLRDDPSGVVVAFAADASWHRPSEQLLLLPWLRNYSRLLRSAGHRIPWPLRKRLLHRGFGRLIAQLQPGDVVWAHNRPEFAAVLCNSVRHFAAHVVLHMHNTHLQTANSRILKELTPDLIVYVSSYLQGVSQPAMTHATPGTVLYNGADGDLFQPGPSRPPSSAGPMRVLFASRIVPEKGAHLFAEALRQLSETSTAVEGLVVGGADFGLSAPDRYIDDLVRNAPANLSFHPYCAGDQLARLFQNADVFCLPSIWHDPFPLAPLEAMAAGLPVVASRSGGIPEALSGGGGILVERGSVESLADALRTLAEDPQLRHRLSIEARQIFERRFCWQHVRDRYQAILRRFADA